MVLLFLFTRTKVRLLSFILSYSLTIRIGVAVHPQGIFATSKLESPNKRVSPNSCVQVPNLRVMSSRIHGTSTVNINPNPKFQPSPLPNLSNAPSSDHHSPFPISPHKPIHGLLLPHPLHPPKSTHPQITSKAFHFHLETTSLYVWCLYPIHIRYLPPLLPPVYQDWA